ncbi:cobaltochelatase subunit CobN [Cupriavidus basilensis]|uniref:cobaltochelatase subunit CobN n=1 Tax=Cupriavidus basilensis TaxID=68895 RepID=UPI000750B6D5|nr:cobaltochelatase subunit CobN [Cupriavidus basilensis]
MRPARQRWLPAAFVLLGWLLLACAQARAAAPVRVLVVTTNTHLLPAAEARLRELAGPGRVELQAVTAAPDAAQIAAADAIYAYFAPTAVLKQMAPAVRQARQRGALVLAAPAAAAEAAWGIGLDAARGPAAEAYWSAGGADNLAGWLAWTVAQLRGTDAIAVPAPRPLPAAGIYHPRAAQVFATLPAYLDWYRANGGLPARAPLAGIAFYASNYRQQDLAHIDALVAALERQGIGAVPVFGWPLSSLDAALTIDGRSPLRALFTLNLTISRAEDKAWLERHGVHAINLIATRDSQAAWRADARGIAGERLPLLLNTPERAGASEPILFATLEDENGAKASRAVPERADAAVARARRWIALQDKPAADKRIAILYYNNPPGSGNIGASYLATLPSLARIMARLRAAGYQTDQAGTALPDEAGLTALLERNGRNMEAWSPGELREMVARGRVTLLPMAQYKRWFDALPAAFRQSVLAAWGPPERNPLMLVDDGRGGQDFVIPGLRFGNLFVGPQPLRSTFARALDTSHDTVTPPPHSYIAAYLWYRHAFGADAVVHVGRHGTLEWLPGKQAGQAGDDSAEVLLGDLPNAYYYIQDGGGEAIQAKRRSAAVLVSHLTPLLTRAGMPAALAKLDEVIEQQEATADGAPALAEQYRLQAQAQIRALGLDRQLGVDLAAPWEQVEPVVHRFLHKVEAEPIPQGIHVLGELPPPDFQRQALATVLESAFGADERKRIGHDTLAGWAGALLDGREPDLADLPPPLADKARAALAAAREWLAGLRASPRSELDGLVTVLAGRYLPTAPLGDPVRTPQGLPTGRNLHAFDGAFIPTPAAWEVGKALARQTLARYRAETGAVPEQVSMVLFYGETERHQGAMESEALYLLGVEPVWNARGVVEDVRLIPDAQLGRPRVNVLFTISGIYRDGFGDKVALLDKAARLAAAAGDNAVSRHDREAEAALLAAGVAPPLAGRLARARVFAARPGNYGIGVQQMVEQSIDVARPVARPGEPAGQALAQQYLRYMNFAFSAEGWGETAPQALASHLKSNQAVLFSRASTLYGALDNDDTYQYAGGLNLATRAVSGQAPRFWLHNLRRPAEAETVDARTWLATELNARNWNPRWIAGMQRSGYAGAREMAREIEHLYGFQATSPEQMSGDFWQQTYDVYVADKLGMDMDRFFARSNPHARQGILARLLEVDRQGSYRFTAAERADMARRYVASVNRDGLSCTANSCGNPALMQYIAGLGQQARVPVDALRAFGERLARAMPGREPSAGPGAAPARHGVAKAPTVPAAKPAQAPSAPPAPTTEHVAGRVFESRVIQLAPSAPLSGVRAREAWEVAALMALLVAAGAGAEWRRGRRPRRSR